MSETLLRQVVLDTETTGLDCRNGDRLVEIGCVEIVGRRIGERRFHTYINPEREVDAGAVAVHGLTTEFLSDKPKFAEVAAQFIDFVRDAELIIHNAAFDVGFLNQELSLLKQGSLDRYCCGVVDTLRMARELRPGKRNNLDVLCSEYGVDNSNRQFHGALLDAELLADVYLAMTRGQNSLAIAFDEPEPGAMATPVALRLPLRVRSARPDELQEHARLLDEIGKESKGKCLWRELEAVLS